MPQDEMRQSCRARTHRAIHARAGSPQRPLYERIGDVELVNFRAIADFG